MKKILYTLMFFLLVIMIWGTTNVYAVTNYTYNATTLPRTIVGSSFAIFTYAPTVSNMSIYGMTSETVVDTEDLVHPVLKGVATEQTSNRSTSTYTGTDSISWTIESDGNNGFYLYHIVAGVKQYLKVDVDSHNGNGVYGITTSTSPEGSFKISTNYRRQYFTLMDNNTGAYVSLNAGTGNYLANRNFNNDCYLRPYNLGNTEDIGPVINYDLTTDYASHVIMNGEWRNEPRMLSAKQFITNDTTTIEAVTNMNDNGRFVYDNYTPYKKYLQEFYDLDAEDTVHFLDSSPGASKNWGKELYLSYWETKDTEGNKVNIKPDSTVKLNNDGTMSVVGMSGDEVKIPEQSNFVARYQEYSDVVIFFLNYSEGIIDDDGSFENEKEYTHALAVGHLYFSNPEYVKHNIETYKDLTSISIKNIFSKTYSNKENDNQIVIEGLLEVDAETETLVEYRPVVGLTPKQIAEHTLNYVDKYKNVLGIDSDNLDTNHYDVLWYNYVEQTDGWHVDGLLRNLKDFLEIEVTFDDIESDKLPEDFKIEILDEDGEVIKTLTLEDENVEKSHDGNTYTWSLNNMLDPKYTLVVYNYEAPEYTVDVNASSDVNTEVGEIDKDATNKTAKLVLTLDSTAKDGVKIHNKYTAIPKEDEKPTNGSNSNSQGENAGSGGSPASGGNGGGQTVIQTIYNGLLPHTGSISAFLVCSAGVVAVAIAIKVRRNENKVINKKKRRK